jgi:hypothetical protein
MIQLAKRNGNLAAMLVMHSFGQAFQWDSATFSVGIIHKK